MQYINDAIRTIRVEPANVLLEMIVCSFSRWKLFSVTNSTKQNDCVYLKGQKKMFLIKIFLIKQLDNV